MLENSKQDYLDALLNIDNDPEAFSLIESLINRHFAMIEHMKKTSLYDVYMYEDRITSKTLESMKIIAFDNEQLKKEVNHLRKKLGLCIKYKEYRKEPKICPTPK